MAIKYCGQLSLNILCLDKKTLSVAKSYIYIRRGRVMETGYKLNEHSVLQVVKGLVVSKFGI